MRTRLFSIPTAEATIGATLVLAASLATAAELRILASHSETGRGEIGCALFASASGFPTQADPAAAVWLPARGTSTECRFSNLASGTYAVAVSHDLNGNRKTDSNWIGIPTESWGVSNNVRPALRAPTFEEAGFRVTAGQAAQITVEVRK